MSTGDVVALDKDDIYLGDPDDLRQFTSNDNKSQGGNIELTIGIQENAVSVSTSITKTTNMSYACASQKRPASPNEILTHNQRGRRIIEEVAQHNAGLKTTGLDLEEDITYIDDICITAVSECGGEVGVNESNSGTIEDGDIIMASDGANEDSTVTGIDDAIEDTTVTGADGANEENTFVTANEDTTVTVNEDGTDDGMDEDGGNPLVEPDLFDLNWIIEDLQDGDKHELARAKYL